MNFLLHSNFKNYPKLHKNYLNMKSIHKFIALAFVALTLGFLGLQSCKEDDATPAPDTRTKTQLITASEWKLTASVCNVAVDTDGKDGASTDLLSQMKPCEKDDTYKFNSDSTTTEKTIIKCLSNEPASYKGSWIFSPDQKTLVWNGDSYSILDLNGNNLIVKYSIKIGADSYELTDTYSH